MHLRSCRVFAALLLAGSAVSPCIAQPVAPQADAGADDLRAALARAAADPRLTDVYRSAGWRLLWSPSAIGSLEQALAERAQHGLDRVSFLSGSSAAGAADEDVRLTAAALRYAEALTRGYVDPETLHEIYTLGRPTIDLAPPLAQAIATGTLSAWLDSLAPRDDAYRQLSQAYLRYREQAAGPQKEERFARTGLIRVGQSDARIPAIVAQLVDSGYLAAGSPSPVGEAYGETAAAAIRQLQRDYGIAADGVIGPDTLKVLNLGPAERARALAIALERRRWLPRTPPETRIDVNTAAAELRYIRDGKVVDRRKVVVGQPDRETPALSSPIFRLVANPTWTVPKSIQNTEFANASADDLASRNMELRDGWIVQRAGPDNALGQVKFDMRNDHAIYLHDTSAPELFARSERHLSHGCVRVEDATGFAEMIAQDEGVTDAWLQAMASGEPTFVPLPREIPVRLLYHNVFVGEDGGIAFRTDPYGWDDPVAKALGFDADPARRSVPGEVDTGP